MIPMIPMIYEEPDPNDVDNDGDGQTENDGDCNDEDGTIYTGADDVTVDELIKTAMNSMVWMMEMVMQTLTVVVTIVMTATPAYPGGADDDADGVDQIVMVPMVQNMWTTILLQPLGQHMIWERQWHQ